MNTSDEFEFVCKHIGLFLDDIENDTLKRKKKLKNECSICLESIKNNTKLRCGHEFCLECLKNWIMNKKNTKTCPLCRFEFTEYINDNTIIKIKETQTSNISNTINENQTLELCNICNLPGRLLICDGCEGIHGYAVHVQCAGYERENTPEEDWFCPWCR